jgi:hypothetical protein
MANEISLSISCDVTKSNFKTSFRPGNVSPDLVSDRNDAGVQTCNTNFAQMLSAGNASTTGYMFFRNLSTGTVQTNDVIDICHASATSYPFARLGPGEVAVLRGSTSLAVTNIQIRVANTSASTTGSLQYLILSP